MKWIKDNWAQLTWVAGIAFVVVVAAIQFWGGQFVDEYVGDHVTALHTDSVSDIPVMQTEITHINDTLKEIKLAQIANQKEILNLLRNMPR